ncbi:MAG: hypothetical protein GXP09_09295 [Gammaproteobacteria bacterium]|nr:hypothetical protein [Gammaproteobacteria bacterium]
MRDKGITSHREQKDVLDETLKSLEELMGDYEPLTAVDQETVPEPKSEATHPSPSQPEPAGPANPPEPEPTQPVQITVTKATPLQNENLDDFPILEDVAIVGRGKTHRFSRDSSGAATLDDDNPVSFPSEDLLNELIGFLNTQLDAALNHSLDQNTEALLRDEIKTILVKWRRGHRDHGVR